HRLTRDPVTGGTPRTRGRREDPSRGARGSVRGAPYDEVMTSGGTGADVAPRGVSTRDVLLDRAAEVTCGPGWSTITMAKLADAAGVSRQTVYNEFGSKSGLAEALVMRELRRFLAVVEDELASGDDLVDALRRTTAAVPRPAPD